MRKLSMITKGDKLVVIKKVTSFLDEGDVVEVVEVDNNGTISFAFGEGFMHKGVMSANECEEHFEKIKDETHSITSEYIQEIMSHSEITVQTVFDKCTIVSCRLPNGFVIVESSACVSPENYDEEIGVHICLDKIADKIWELEGYRLQENIYALENECPYGCDSCDECDCPLEDCDDCELEEEDCDDYCDMCGSDNCPYNINR